MPTSAVAQAQRAWMAVALAMALALSGISAAGAQSASGSQTPAAKLQAAAQRGSAKTTSRTLAGQYLVELGDGVRVVDVAADYRGVVSVRRHYRRALNGFAAAMSAEVAERLRADARVVAVEADAQITLSMAQSSAPWGLDRTDQRHRPLDGYYNYDAAGRGVVVYIVDSGVYRGHSQFGKRVVSGYDATGEGTTSDCVGHGTHVAGTVAGRTYGVAKAARIVPIRVLDCHGSGTKSQLIAGLDWLVRHHRRSVPAVANLSLGGLASRVVDRAVVRVMDDKVTVVAAAGNEGDNACYYSPARIQDVITVGAANRYDEAPYWSNYGPCLDLFAPGVNIRSAGTWSRSASLTEDGTSMAAPFVAGAAAVYLSQRRSAYPATVARVLKGRATAGVMKFAGWNTTQSLLHVPSHVPTRLVLGLSDSGLDKGERTQIRTILRSSLTGATLPNEVVRFYRRTAGTATWQYLTARRTNADGRAVLADQPLRPSEYLVRHPRSATTRASASRIVGANVSHRWATTLGIGASASIVDPGQAVTFAGTLRRLYDGGGLSGVRVQLQRRPAGASTWSWVATRVTDSQGLARVEGIVPDRTTHYRLRFGGNKTLAPAMSGVRTVYVR